MTLRRQLMKLRLYWPFVVLVVLQLCLVSRELWFWQNGYPCSRGTPAPPPAGYRGFWLRVRDVFFPNTPTPRPPWARDGSFRAGTGSPALHSGEAHDWARPTRTKPKSAPKSRRNQIHSPKVLEASDGGPSLKPTQTYRRSAAAPGSKRPIAAQWRQASAAANRTVVRLVEFPKRDAAEEELGLGEAFLRKLRRSRTVRGLPVPPMRDNQTCTPLLHVDAPCHDPQCAATWNGSRDLASFRQFLQEQPKVPQKYMDAISEMGRADNSRRYQLMVVMAISANHYYEVQALLHNLHTLLLPALASVDHVLVLYDLGMTPQQRRLMTKYCKCQVRSFSLEAFPSKLRSLRCYAWKPIIVAANLPYTQHLLWLDASVRFTSDNLTPVLTELERSGFLVSRSCWGLAYNVHPSMLNFYRMPSVCALSEFFEWENNLMAFASTKLTMATILGPWLACTFAPDCMCPPGHEKFFKSPRYHAYSKCHRFDQSSINMILLRLYGDRMPLLTFPRYIYHTIKRSTIMHYFPEEP